MADWITMNQAAEISGYHPKHLGRLIGAGKITERLRAIMNVKMPDRAD